MGKTMTSADSQGTVILALSKEEAALLIETAQPILVTPVLLSLVATVVLLSL